MKKISFFVFLISFTTQAFSQNIRSNHSYKNLGFTQLPQVSVGGYIDFAGSKSKQTKGYGDEVLDSVYSYNYNSSTWGLQDGIKNNRTDDVNFATEASLLFKVNGINDYGFRYGAIIELNANSTQNSQSDNDINAKKSYIYTESLLGKFEFGSELAANKKMKIDASTFARGTGGINGKYINYINLPSINTSEEFSPLFILIPEHPTSHGGYAMGYDNLVYLCDINGDGNINQTDEIECYVDNSDDNYRMNFQGMENATKVSYYTPEILGFQAGISYTPDTGNKGVSDRFSTKIDTGDIDDVIGYGVSFNKTFYGLNVSAAVTGEKGKSESKTSNGTSYESFREDLNSIQYGGALSFYGLTVGGSIGNWDNSLNYKDAATENDGKYTTLGVAYEFLGFGASVGYFDSTFQKNKYTAYSVSVDYKVAEGFLPYIEYTDFKFDANSETVTNNKGSVILAGFILNF